MRAKFRAVTDRLAAFQAQSLNVHVEFPPLQRLAPPSTVATARLPGIKIHDTRMIRLMKIRRHGGTQLPGWRATQIHQALLTAYGLSDQRYSLNPLRSDLRKTQSADRIALLPPSVFTERDSPHFRSAMSPESVPVAMRQSQGSAYLSWKDDLLFSVEETSRRSPRVASLRLQLRQASPGH